MWGGVWGGGGAAVYDVAEFVPASQKCTHQ